MNTKALEDLEALLINFPTDHKFNIDYFCSDPLVTTEAQAVECGTACCAAGWAILALDSWKSKFRLSEGVIHSLSARFTGGWEMFSDFLGIPGETVGNLFSPRGYELEGEDPTPLNVAKRIRGVLDQ